MNIISFKELNSTNTYVKEHINELEDRVVVSANMQTEGYGRFERKWVDVGEENIYMTFALKPYDELKPVCANLTQYLSVCLCKELEKLELRPQIKWPNDVLINGKKVCGILAETVIRSGKLKGIALGIGINLNASADNLGKIDRPATSLNLELGRNISKVEFMESLINSFFEGYDEFLENGFESIKDFYDEKTLFNTGETLKIAVFNKVKEGNFIGFDNDGSLLLKLSDGKIENINMGEIV